MTDRATRALLGLAVRLLPAAMREEFGCEIVGNGVRRISERAGVPGRLRVVIPLLVDIVAVAVAEWGTVLTAWARAFSEPRRAEGLWAIRSLGRRIPVPGAAVLILVVGCAGAGTAGWMVVDAFRGVIPGLPGSRTVTVWPGLIADDRLVTNVTSGVPELDRIEGSRHLLGLLGEGQKAMLLASVTEGYLEVAGGTMTRGGTVAGSGEEVFPLVLARSFWESAFDANQELIGTRMTLASDADLTVEITGVYEPPGGIAGGVLGWLVTGGRQGWYYSSFIGVLAPGVSRHEAGQSLRLWADSVSASDPTALPPASAETAGVAPFHWPTIPRLRRAMAVVALLAAGIFALTVGCVRVVIRPVIGRRRSADAVARSVGSPIRSGQTFDWVVGILVGAIALPGTAAATLLLRAWLGGSDDPILGRELGLGSPFSAMLLAGGLSLGGALLSVTGKRTGLSFSQRRPRRVAALTSVTMLGVISTAFAAGIWTTREAQLTHHVGFSPHGISAVRFRVDAGVSASSVLTALRAHPGIERAAFTQALPLTGERWSGFAGLRPRGAGADRTPPRFEPAGLRIVSAGFFRALGISVREGRDFVEEETGVVAVSESLARALDPSGPVLGRQVAFPWDSTTPYRIVAVVGDVADVPPDGKDTAELYMTNADWPVSWHWVVASGPGADPEELDRILAGIPGVATFGTPVTVPQIVDRSRLLYESFFRLGGMLGLCSLLVSLVALLGITTQTVRERSLDLNLRQVLGAAPQRIAAEGVGYVWLALWVGGAIGVALLALLERSGLAGGVVGPLTAPGILAATLLLSVVLPGILALALAWHGTRRLSAVEVLNEG